MKHATKKIKKHFWAHEGNDHHPHLMRNKSLKALVAIAILVLGAGILGRFVVSNSGFLAAIEAAFLVDLANEERQDFGVRKLSVNPQLVEAAQLKADDMAKNSYFAHTSPAGVDPWHWFGEAKYNFKYAGENLAVNFNDSVKVANAWMDSPTHKANILNYRFTEVGIAQSEGFYKGKKTIFVVQMFGRPTVKASNMSTISTPVVIAQNTQEPEDSNVPEQTSVQGQKAEVAEQFDEDYQTLELTAEPLSTEEEPELFIIASRGEDDLAQADAASSDVNVVPEYTSNVERLIVSPQTVTQYLLMALAALILFAIIVRLFVEIRRHHVKHILMSVGVLAIIVIVIIIQQELIFGEVIILG